MKGELLALSLALPMLGSCHSPAPRGGGPHLQEKEEIKVVFIAGAGSHGAGAHDHEEGLLLLKSCLDTAPGVKNVMTEVHSNNWPQDPQVLDDVDTIVLANDGWDEHLLALPERRQKIGELMKRGVGLVCLHGATAVSDDVEPEFIEWLGGNKKKGYSLHPYATVKATLAAPEHPTCRGVEPFTAEDEFYFRILFRRNDRRVTPVLTAMLPPEDPKPEVIAWAVERRDGGRGFGITGPHYHKSWRIEGLRKVVLNAILWTAGVEVPAEGVQSSLAARNPIKGRPVGTRSQEAELAPWP